MDVYDEEGLLPNIQEYFIHFCSGVCFYCTRTPIARPHCCNYVDPFQRNYAFYECSIVKFAPPNFFRIWFEHKRSILF